MNGKNTGPATIWQQKIESGLLIDDPAQKPVINALQSLYQQLQMQASNQAGFLSRWLRRQAVAPQGLYIWGDVGRGKTMLMDLFYDALPAASATRLHFHRFMQKIQLELRRLEGQADPLQTIAKNWGNKKVLCFDEFYVSDIADAMLLGELMKALFAEGVVLVATSNTAPENLYQGGLQRARFLPAIDTLYTHCQVLPLHSPTDYRLQILEKAAVYHCPPGASAETAMLNMYTRINPGSERGQSDLLINSRLFHANHRGDGIVWFEFIELCEKPRGSMDYIELARAFNTLFIANIPVFNDQKTDSLRRFINLVDEFYDRNVKLILSAAAAPEQLYRGRKLAFEFRRTRSRLVEMQSRQYLARAHRP